MERAEFYTPRYGKATEKRNAEGRKQKAVKKLNASRLPSVIKHGLRSYDPNCLLPSAYFFSPSGFTASPSVGSFASFQAAMPPSSAAALSIPFALSVSTAPALVCSLGQVQ